MTARKIEKASKGLGGVDLLEHHPFGSRQGQYGRLALGRGAGIARPKKVHVVVDFCFVKVRRAPAEQVRHGRIRSAARRRQVRPRGYSTLTRCTSNGWPSRAFPNNESGFGGSHGAWKQNMSDTPFKPSGLSKQFICRTYVTQRANRGTPHDVGSAALLPQFRRSLRNGRCPLCLRPWRRGNGPTRQKSD